MGLTLGLLTAIAGLPEDLLEILRDTSVSEVRRGFLRESRRIRFFAVQFAAERKRMSWEAVNPVFEGVPRARSVTNAEKSLCGTIADHQNAKAVAPKELGTVRVENLADNI